MGRAWTGKTTLLHDAGVALRQAGFSPVFLSAGGISKGAMGCAQAVLSSLDPAKTAAVTLQLSTSAGDSVSEAVDTMNTIAELLSGPVLILDALDEAESPRDLLSQLEPIIARTKGWRYLMSSRPDPHTRRRLLPWLDVYELDYDASRVSLTTPSGKCFSMGDHLSRVWNSSRQEVEGLLDSAVTDPLSWKLLLRLSLCGPQSLQELQAALHVDPKHLKLVANVLGGTRHLLAYRENSDLAVAHDVISRRVLERQLAQSPFSLSHLSFGTEEGESDPLLDSVYQTRGGARDVGATYSIVLGSRGSGKSALVRRITEGKQSLSQHLIAAPIIASSSALTRLVPRDRWDDHDSLRAAWTLLVAAEVAMRLPDGASDSLKARAQKILAAAGRGGPLSLGQRVFQWVRTTLGGSKLQFSLGLVKLDAPLGSAVGSATVNLETFLRDADESLLGAGSGVVCLFDRVDEIYKHDRAKQEACVQALLQVERELSALSHLERIKMVVFLRDDLLQAYDIEEKNKLVSRTLRLDWSADDWITVLVRRLGANSGLMWLRDITSLDRPGEAVLALSRLLPNEVEGLPVDRWLFESLRDGNGQISPRLAVLLLLFARDLSPNREQVVSELPLFQEGILRSAMDRVSELAYDEVVSDFKIASTFVSNCRAAKLTKFQFEDVAPFFGKLDGNASDQVRALERLGFLERVAVAENNSVSVYFRIPKVFSRSWAH